MRVESGVADTLIAMLLEILTHDNATELVEFAAEVFPQRFHLTQNQVAHLMEADLTVGVRENGVLSGILIAWQDDTQVEGWDEQVVYVEHLAGPILPLLDELENFAAEAGLPIEATINHSLHAELLLELEANARWGGYTLTHRYDFEEDGESWTWLRFESGVTLSHSDLWVGGSFLAA